MLKGWKTVLFGVAIMALGVLGDADVRMFVSAHWHSVVPFMGLAVIVLRVVTNSPVFRKGAQLAAPLLLIGGTLALGACGNLLSNQGYAGVTHVTVDKWVTVKQPDGTVAAFPNVEWVDGKDKAAISMTADLHTGKFTYTASNVNGSVAIASRADVQKAVTDSLAKAGVQVAPSVVQGIVDAVTGGAAGVAPILKGAAP